MLKTIRSAMIVVVSSALLSCGRSAPSPPPAIPPTKEPTPVGLTAGPGSPASPPAIPPSKELTLDLGNMVTMRLTLIPAGAFQMGSSDEEQKAAVKDVASGGMPELIGCSALQGGEGPQHKVTISRPFYLGVCEVTRTQYGAIVGEELGDAADGTNPVDDVTWEDAVEFCKKLSAKTGRLARLPTEAEWEYACRAGTTTRFGFGDADTDLHKFGNYRDKSSPYQFPWRDQQHDDGHWKIAPVGSLKPNGFGLYDMHGNVWEWCADRYDSYANAATRDPKGPSSTSLVFHVLRGGAWFNLPGNCRSASRGVNPDALGNYGVQTHFRAFGFRVAVDTGDAPTATTAK